ncbi:hypothetical protein AWH69_00705 [Janibacter melonis]|uniref:Dicarboxylate carrier MatC N-terminal domain-containing protein n=1 Tax=Janibacter melonis TaxID=262209 RepID=A0A176QFA4_9MICO|nr:SLC13 family permease [Janibacter melonis]OAB88372.1 hypothetical protein AWH69_00705 [Janibacter melonis]
MSDLQYLALGGFVVIFALAMWRGTNMGAIALVGTFLVGTLLFDLSPDDLVAGWPTSLMLTLVGVTFLFGIARENGTVDRVVSSAVRAAGGRLLWIPWVFFGLAAFITGAGAVTPATNAILVPVGLAVAARYKVNPVLIGVSILNGTNAGAFSPLAIYYNIIAEALAEVGLDLHPGPVFVATFVANTLLNLLAFAVFGGLRLRGRRAEAVEIDDVRHEGWQPVQLLTLAVLLAVTVAALLKVDIGFASITGAVVLALVAPEAGRRGAGHIAWSVVLLIGGIITYVSMLQSIGTVEAASTQIAGLGAPLLVALLLLFVAGLTSAFASTIAMFGILVPLTAPLISSGSLPLVGFAIALAIAASAVDSSPMSTGGALVVANSPEEDQQRVFTRLLQWGLAMVVVAPVGAWLAFVVL